MEAFKEQSGLITMLEQVKSYFSVKISWTPSSRQGAGHKDLRPAHQCDGGNERAACAQVKVGCTEPGRQAHTEGKREESRRKTGLGGEK